MRGDSVRERNQCNAEEECSAVQHALFTAASSSRRLSDKLPASSLIAPLLICKSTRLAEKSKLATCRTICLYLSLSLPPFLSVGLSF